MASRWASDEVRDTKRFYGWPEDAQFLVPDGVYAHFADGIGTRGAAKHAPWRALFARYRAAHPDLARPFDAMQGASCLRVGMSALPTFPADPKGIASRDSSAQVENAIAQAYPLADRRRRRPGTVHQDAYDLRGRRRFPAGQSPRPQPAFRRPRARDGRGSEWHGAGRSCVRSVPGFLIFSDYMRNPIRLSAIMELPVALHLHA